MFSLIQASIPPSAPVISARGVALNIAASVTTSSLSVVGLNFVMLDYTPSGRLGAAPCDTSGWTSGTSVYCMAALTDPLVVTVGGTGIGTMTFSFTYDGACPRPPARPAPPCPFSFITF